MFCPSCRDEFREGFTHCGRCDVDLVDELDAAEEEVERAKTREENLAAVIPMADYCGFFDLAEARKSRDSLREIGIHCEIAIREQPGASLAEPAVEEFWLRVEHARLRQAGAFLQAAEAESAAQNDQESPCPACGTTVPADAPACPDCGIGFES